MSGNRIINNAELFIDGVKVPTKGKSSFKPKFTKVETVEDHKEILGEVGETVFPTVKAKVIFKNKATFDMIEQVSNATVVLKGDNDKSIVLTGARRIGDMGEISIGDGAEYDVEFKGNNLEEQ